MAQPLGDRELALLRFVTRHAPIAGNDVAEALCAEWGVARPTIITMLERLRQKGYLTRRRRDGVFRYSPVSDETEVTREVCFEFRDRRLDGTFSPLFTCISSPELLSEQELADLREMVERLGLIDGGDKQ